MVLEDTIPDQHCCVHDNVMNYLAHVEYILSAYD